jgi:hypothetical protein
MQNVKARKHKLLRFGYIVNEENIWVRTCLKRRKKDVEAC